MIVRKPIGPVKIEGTLARLEVGRPVPSHVIEHWGKTGELSELCAAGCIEEEAAVPSPDVTDTTSRRKRGEE